MRRGWLNTPGGPILATELRRGLHSACCDMHCNYRLINPSACTQPMNNVRITLLPLLNVFILVFTYAVESHGVKRLSASVSVSVCLHDRIKTAKMTITKHATEIGLIHHESLTISYRWKGRRSRSRVTNYKTHWRRSSGWRELFAL